jgi:splicing factor U2AF subunit
VYQVGGALPTKVVCLTQVVTADELRDDEEYEDIVEDMREEGRKYGILHETLDFSPLLFRALIFCFIIVLIVFHNAIAECFIVRPMQYWQSGLNLQKTHYSFEFD